MENIWSSLSENYDFSLPRMNAITVKEDELGLGFFAPSPDNRIGYQFLNTNLSVYNQDRYTFELYFAAYEYPSTCGAIGTSRFLFSEQTYHPDQISHKFHFPNSALAGEESFSAVCDGSITWSFTLRNTSVPLCDPNHIYRYSKKIYSIFTSHDGFSALKNKDGVICINLKNQDYFIASDTPVRIAVFDNEQDAYESMGENFRENFGYGRVMCIETELSIDINESLKLTFGMSSHGTENALDALAVTNPDKALADKWNAFFRALPTVDFDNATPEERKLYYKAWWIIKQNYCDYPGWGFNVLESLPVYKGIWQWAIPAVEWYSSQDPEHLSEWIKSAMNILISAQRKDGYITHAAYLHEEVPGLGWMERGIIQNPQLPGTAVRYYNACCDKASLETWYPHFRKYYEFLCRNFDENHENLHLWALHSSYDTGLDTFPAFQKVTYGINDTPPTEYCYGSILSAERYHYECSMARICEICGFDEESFWLEEAEKTKTAINKVLWDDKKSWYGVRQEGGELDTRVGVDGLFPLLYGIADSKKLAAAEKSFHLLIGKFGIRTCAKNEDGFFSDIYWRGPCWPKSCSLATAIAKKYYPHLSKEVFKSVLAANLAYPNIWECIDVDTGKLARSNVGYYSTPCMSSNVGAGELIGAIWAHHGFDMFGTEQSLPLIPMKDYHYRGLFITVTEENGKFSVTAREAERTENNVVFSLPDGNRKNIKLISGTTIAL